MRIFVESGFRAVKRVLSDPLLPPSIRCQGAKIWARFYAMLAGGYFRNRQPWESLLWGWRALATSPIALGDLAGFPVRRLRRALLLRKKISFARELPFACALAHQGETRVSACASSS